MDWKKRDVCKLIKFCLYMVLCFRIYVYSQEVIELKLSHFCPIDWAVHSDVIEPWTKKIESLTDGKVKFTIYPHETLGKANQLYDLAVRNTTDIAISITEYTPGRFPLSSCMELPYLGACSAEDASLVYWNLYNTYLHDEFKDTHILWLFCHGLGQLHTTTKAVKTLEDLKGLKIRVGDPKLAQTLDLLGAAPIVCGVYDGYTMLKEGKLDGAVIPWEGAMAFRYLDFCKYHTEINLYVLPFFVAMNKAKYESLPKDIRKIIDDNSGEEMAVLSGRAAQRMEIVSKRFSEERGDLLYSLSQSETERWKKIVTPIGDNWVEQIQARGLPGQNALNYVLELFRQIELNRPIELKISHFVLPVSPLHTDILIPWSKKVETISNGQVRFSIYPKETLGKVNTLYEYAIRNLTDIAVSITETDPERFPLSSCMELPFLGIHSSSDASMAYWGLYEKYFKDEFRDTHVLWLYCLGPGQLHTTRPVRTLEDLKGLRIRAGNSAQGRALELLGAIPVNCDIYTGLTLVKEGSLDGVITGWYAVSVYGYLDFCTYHTEINMYVVPFFAVMNKERYASLPPDILKIINDTVGEETVILSSQAMDRWDTKCKKIALDRGDLIYTPSASELERWKNVTQAVKEDWIKKMEIKGLPGKEVLNEVQETLHQMNSRASSENPIELKISHFGPVTWTVHTKVLKPWAERIESLTRGKIRFTFFPQETLGKAGEQYNLVLQGTTDISCGVTDYTSGQFAISSIMTLPFLGVQQSEDASLTYWRLYKKYLEDTEFKDVKVLYLFCTGPGQIHTVNTPIQSAEDLKGLRIRVSNSYLARAFELMGAIPTVCSITEGEVMMKNGKLDGICVCWDAITTYQYVNFCKYHTEINMYTSPLYVVMNKKKYESLPPDIQKIIDENSGEPWAVIAGHSMDHEDSLNRQLARSRGDTVYILSPAELEKWKRLTMPIGDEWIRELQAKGLPGQEIVAYANETLIYINDFLKKP